MSAGPNYQSKLLKNLRRNPGCPGGGLDIEDFPAGSGHLRCEAGLIEKLRTKTKNPEGLSSHPGLRAFDLVGSVAREFPLRQGVEPLGCVVSNRYEAC